MAFAALCAPVRAQVPTPPPDGGSHLVSPTCGVQDRGGLAANDFRAGAEFVLNGAKFPADVLVLVTFSQPPQTVELARFKTGAEGAFTSQPTVLRIPADAGSGPSAIRVASSGGSATCDVRVVAAGGTVARPEPEPSSGAADDTGDFGPWLVVWAILLSMGAGYLAYLRYRRWQEGRLEQEISQLNGDPRRGWSFKTDPRLTRQHVAKQRRTERKRLRLGDIEQQVPSPPVLRPGWDAGHEPTPAQPPPSRHE